MRSQFILLYLILILFMTLYFISNLQNDFYYQQNIGKYIAQDFYVKLLLYPNYSSIINQTYYNICILENIICYDNGTNIIVITQNSEYILNKP
ncbi:MAG: hypothetical protein ACO2OX_02360 [Candidatus Nanopusillus sp.]|jgi:hypothetical protein